MPQLVEGNPYILVADFVEDLKWGVSTYIFQSIVPLLLVRMT